MSSGSDNVRVRKDSTPGSELASNSAETIGRWSAVVSWRPQAAGGVDGSWRPQLDPGRGTPFAHVLDLDAESVVHHVEMTRAAYEAGPILPWSERARMLERMAVNVEEASQDLGELDALCTGKRLADAIASARAGASVLRYYARLLDGDPYSSSADADVAGMRQLVDRLPVGLAACILPWNFPVSQACARLAMLFAAGNAGIYKGSELAQPPLLALEELAHAADLPDWAFSVVTGGPEAGRALVEAPLVDAVCFTGGVRTGLAVASSAIGSLKRLILELGGKTPFVVFSDADREQALEVGLKAAFDFQGQACNAGSLLLIEEDSYEEFLERFAASASQLRIGHQLEEATQVGPMVSSDQRDRVAGMVDEAVQLGARLHTGGESVTGLGDGFFYRPTVLSEVPQATAAADEEVFGPAVVAYPFRTESEIIRRVNDSSYGLAATVWTTDRGRADRLRQVLRVGQLYINTHGHTARNVPWGGFRLSGLGRLYGRDGLYAFTEARSTYIADSLR